ncbi:hypothetical protein N0V90_009759 [Kalmusia sp. IMI 367209]|nr:hypothetical protein N0V90_009759 [Kalmusia sp. IMI 367209]
MPVVGGSVINVVVDRLMRNYLEFQAHMARIRMKAQAVMEEMDLVRFETHLGQVGQLLAWRSDTSVATYLADKDGDTTTTQQLHDQ